MRNESDTTDPSLTNSNETPAPVSPVGFCRPPEATRFKPGVSGNPKGRPKGSLNVATAFMKVLREKVVINEHGQRKAVTKLEAALKQLVNKAASGDLRAIAQLRELAREAEDKQTAASAQQNSIVNDADREVMNSILKRFRSDTGDVQSIEEAQQPEEA